jgi:uncharacterized membrane protein YadS
MFFVATRVFKFDKRFGAVLGAGGAVCGVSAFIAVGGAVKADKEGAAINVPLGYFLSTVVFRDYWMAVP